MRGAATLRWPHRYGSATGIVVVLWLVCRPVGIESAEPASPRLRLASERIPDVVARWNAAVDHCREGDWLAASRVLPPDDRTGWTLPGKSNINLLELHLSTHIGGKADSVLVYEAEDGTFLAKIYRDRNRREAIGTTPVALRDRFLVGAMTRQPNRAWYVDSLLSRDDRPFGLGHSVEGIRLSVGPPEQTIQSWQELKVTVALQNTGKTETVAVRRKPSFYLQWNLAFGLVRATPQSAANAFADWYTEAEGRSAPLLLRAMHAPHEPASLAPGQRQEVEIRLGTLCWTGDSFPKGPSGTFDLFLVYDANLEWDQVEAALPTWSHRVASNAFRVTVSPTTEKNEE